VEGDRGLEFSSNNKIENKIDEHTLRKELDITSPSEDEVKRATSPHKRKFGQHLLQMK